MDDEGFGIADVGEVGDQLEVVHELLRARAVAFEDEGKDSAEAAGEILPGLVVGRVVLEAFTPKAIPLAFSVMSRSCADLAI
jgi:hypothetical protein